MRALGKHEVFVLGTSPTWWFLLPWEKFKAFHVMNILKRCQIMILDFAKFLLSVTCPNKQKIHNVKKHILVRTEQNMHCFYHLFYVVFCHSYSIIRILLKLILIQKFNWHGSRRYLIILSYYKKLVLLERYCPFNSICVWI